MSKVCKIDSDREQFWRMAIATWQASGLSVRQFCTQEGLTSSAFYGWRKKLAGDAVKSDNDVPKPPAFIEVAMPGSNPVAVELLLTSGSTVRISRGVDTATLSTVLSVARSVGLC